MNRRRLIVGAALTCATALAVSQCSSKPSSVSPEAAREDTSANPTPVLSVHELMEHMIDPTADWIFDAAVIDVSTKGTVETKPVSDEDWLKVERGLLQLAESTNLLKMPRPIATSYEAPAPGELSHAEIESKVSQNRALWNKYSDGLRVAAVDSLKVVRARNAEGLFQVGNDIDTACENCHLEFWYPGDKERVAADQKKRATFDPPKK